MKKFLILSLCFLLSLTCVRASLPLTGKTIVLDIGHGGDDPGTSYQNVLEKDINLAIGLELEKELSKTISTVDDILNNQTITNAMLKTIIDVIEVDDDANIEVRLKLLNDIGSTPTVLKSNFSTQRCNWKVRKNQPCTSKRS